MSLLDAGVIEVSGGCSRAVCELQIVVGDGDKGRQTEIGEPPLAPPFAWLTEPGLRIVARYGVAAVVIAWVATRLVILLFVNSKNPAASTNLLVDARPWFGGDVRNYHQWAGALLQGLVPYRDLSIQYPPGAVVLFAIPRLFATSLEGYALAFGLEMIVFEGLVLLFVWRIAALIVGRPRGRGDLARPAQVFATLGYVALSALLGRLVIRRFDAAVGMLIVAFVYCVLSNRRPLRAELVLALGIWTKLMPATLVPLYLVVLHHREAEGVPFLRWLATRGWRIVARLGVFVAALMAPFAWMARGGLLQILNYQAGRGLQIESLPASFLVFVQSLHDIGAKAGGGHGAVEISHPLSSVLTTASDVGVVAAVVAIAMVCSRRLRDADSPAAGHDIFIAGTVATLLAVMGISKLFSPQYLLWIAALFPLTQANGARRSLVLAGIAVFALTGYLYLFDYERLVFMSRLPASFLLLRNLSLVWLVWRLVAPAAASAELGAASVPAAARDDRAARAVAAAVALAIAAWIVATNVTPLRAGELWSDLHIGREIVTTHVLPHKDTVTVTGRGADMAFPGWLSAVSFYALIHAAGAWALCLLQPVVAGGCALLLLFSVRREARRSAAVVPVLLLAMHVIASRIDVRHQMFSPLAVAALGFALQRWRRSGRLRELAWLVPLQVVWANLNGGALAAPMLVALLALVAGGAARATGDTFCDGDRTLGGRDALVLGALAVALFLASLCNPYGLGQALWTPGWDDGDGQSVLANAVLHQYPTWSCGALAVVLWLVVALRWSRHRPVLDVAIAAFATFMSLRASRFLPYVAILGFPIIVRSVRDLVADFVAAPAPRRWLGLELGLSLVVLAAGVVDGYRLDEWTDRPLGLGVARQLPLGEVQLLKKLGLEGAVFNDRALGGLIAFNLSPGLLPVIDARPDAANSERWAEYKRAYDSPTDFLDYVDRYGVRFVLLHVEPGNIPILRLLGTDERWRLVSDNDGYGLYVHGDVR
jgi:hypothetical protein